MWDMATATFSDNFPGATLFTAPINTVTAPEVQRTIGAVDLLLASPECTNHTCARGSRPKEEGSRETAFQVLRFARALAPRWIVVENVVHMRPWERYDEFVQALRNLGYDVAEHVLDAADFGVPQRRRRLFLLCDNRATAPEHLPRRTGPKPGARSILDRPGTWPTTLLHNGRRAPATIERAERGIEGVGKSEPFLMVYYGTDGSGGWQSLDAPLRTITTLDRFALVEPGPKGHTMRMLQVPELARAMGFSPDYMIGRGTRRDRIRLMGNGVCPPVMQTIVSTMCVSALKGRGATAAAR